LKYFCRFPAENSRSKHFESDNREDCAYVRNKCLADNTAPGGRTKPHRKQQGSDERDGDHCDEMSTSQMKTHLKPPALLFADGF
jgi:hypothetical protein